MTIFTCDLELNYRHTQLKWDKLICCICLYLHKNKTKSDTMKLVNVPICSKSQRHFHNE